MLKESKYIENNGPVTYVSNDANDLQPSAQITFCYDDRVYYKIQNYVGQKLVLCRPLKNELKVNGLKYHFQFLEQIRALVL